MESTTQFARRRSFLPIEFKPKRPRLRGTGNRSGPFKSESNALHANVNLKQPLRNGGEFKLCSSLLSLFCGNISLEVTDGMINALISGRGLFLLVVWTPSDLLTVHTWGRFSTSTRSVLAVYANKYVKSGHIFCVVLVCVLGNMKLLARFSSCDVLLGSHCCCLHMCIALN